MPAQVRAVLVAEANLVESGQTLMLLEAMKMEIKLQAPRRGRVVRLPVQEGQSVDRDQVLVELSEEPLP
jgi:biotin carboxyl carrier protein